MVLIKGKLNDLIETHVVAAKFQAGLNLLKETDFSPYSAGRHELDENLFFFLNEYETKNAEECFWEAHQKYLDVHYILEGKEAIAVDHIDNQKVKEEYDEVKDAIFFEGNVDSTVTMTPGDVMICFPEDSHMTGIIAGEKQKVRKVVLKVKL
ncbi:YhcH/YjgK/YiaL family protein [Neobacillus niacini]|uniref:YhcH/YjgK/YiaL family protein n=1 Tax=Neobacillus niacini TaxID=86668 RepID=UPI002FFEAFF1